MSNFSIHFQYILLNIWHYAFELKFDDSFEDFNENSFIIN